MNEFDLIKAFFVRNTSAESVVCGIGDDCAVLSPPTNQKLVVSIDTHVAGRHFPENTEADLIAARALHCAVSDLAAMGAEPLWFTLALSLPAADHEWLRDFSQGLFAAADMYGIDLVGGDTTQGPLTVSIQVHGCAPEDQLLMRKGAKPGDLVFVTGTLGDGRAGLECVLGNLNAEPGDKDYLLHRYYHPNAQILSGLKLRGIASSCIDISDGLLADLQHICKINQVGAEIDTSLLPLSAAMLKSVDGESARVWALTGGDDYQLCFTVSPENRDTLMMKSNTESMDITQIGRITEGENIVDAQTGEQFEYENTGYTHF